MKTALIHLDYLNLTTQERTRVAGCNQDWYPVTWQRRAGCGPTTATNLLIYHQRAGRILVQQNLQSTADGLQLMQRVWHYVKPTAMGVHTPGIFQFGMQKLIDEIALTAPSGVNQQSPPSLSALSLLIPRQKTLRPTLSVVVSFIREGLQHDSPVAFLNLSNGSIRRLDKWHWVTVTGIIENSPTAVELEICDNLSRFTISLDEWFESTSLGGGFVYLKAVENMS
ncbi:MAG: hypothetical protein PHC86_09025 [Eubacteriales bacterium]|nr:hypothetical protein [Eubacteriales bacterium]